MTGWPQISIDTGKDYSLCFGCGQDNPFGLKLSFQWDGKTARAEFTPTEFYQGWAGVVHGGIIICILDEAMSYAALFEGMYCATTKIQVNLKSPASIDETLIITSSLTKRSRKLVETKAAVSLKNGTLIAEGTATHFILNTKPGNASGKKEGSSEVKAIIWDMDGVIADTAPYHFKAWQQVFQKRGVEFTKEDFKRKFGQRNDIIIRETLGEDMPQDEVDAIVTEKEIDFRNRVRQRIKSFPGAINLIKLLADHGFKIALASSAPVENIQLITTSLGIADYFQAIISGRDVAEGKPSPQGFLLAAQRLGVNPKNCIVIEDAIAGVAAAKRAGMHCLAVTNTHPRERLSGADLIVDTLEASSVNDLERLLTPSKKGLQPI